MRSESKKVQQMFGSIAGRYDLLNAVLSGGAHYLWQRKLFALLPPIDGGCVLDLCTGTGALLPGLSKRYRSVVGIDFCQPMLTTGAARFARSGLKLAFARGDALQLPLADASVDLITVAYGVRNFENLRDGLREMRRVLRPSGRVAILEFGQPEGRLWSKLYRFYSASIMPRLGTWISGNAEAYSYLPETAAQFPCGSAFETVLGETGYKPISTTRLWGGIAFLYLAEVTKV